MYGEQSPRLARTLYGYMFGVWNAYREHNALGQWIASSASLLVAEARRHIFKLLPYRLWLRLSIFYSLLTTDSSTIIIIFVSSSSSLSPSIRSALFLWNLGSSEKMKDRAPSEPSQESLWSILKCKYYICTHIAIYNISRASASSAILCVCLCTSMRTFGYKLHCPFCIFVRPARCRTVAATEMRQRSWLQLQYWSAW